MEFTTIWGLKRQRNEKIKIIVSFSREITQAFPTFDEEF